MFPQLWLTLIAAASVLGTQGRQLRKEDIRERQVAAAQRWRTITGIEAAHAHSFPVKRASIKNITFSNPAASQFYVDGTTIPEVDFDIGPSWSGLLPISSDPNETRKASTAMRSLIELFFWFFPPGPDGSLDDLIFWTNGGPGCSSLEGLLQENGACPFQWGYGQAKATVNEFSWTNLSSVLWVEQPVGTGFSQGEPNIKNEDDLAAQLVGFLQQFLEVFSELKNKNLYLSGESYAGAYVPYIANFIYEHPTLVDLSLQGIWISDPSLSWDVVQEQIPAVDFVHKYEHVFAFNQSFMAQLDALAAKCNYAGYFAKHVTYPPQGLLPLPGKSTSADPGCDAWDIIFEAALIVNPAFNIYRIFDTYPILWDVLGFPYVYKSFICFCIHSLLLFRGSFEQVQVSPIYFDREDVKRAIHAPVNVTWTECSNINVFPRGDGSLPSALSVLPNVIEKSNRTVIVHGLADFILIAEGMTCELRTILLYFDHYTEIILGNGRQGFQTPIANDSFIVDGVGALGNTHNERGLTYVEVQLSGHMVPQFSPVAAFQIMQYLMGMRATP
ncbi:Carboxypeptidase cpdS [Termitomyces sp. J132]|nr:Carboxypeptidase cpdS [Termitomyces sp. J132]